jgi:methylmalonyl-CoA mutase N-terminal domain/subunit
MCERFGAQDPRSCMLRFHAQTGGSTLTAQQPMNNVARVTIQALAAVLGGAQSLHTNSMDEALWLPTEESVRTALRTQQIIAHESGVANVVDPLGGSFVVEHLTDEIEARARALIDEIDRMGGAVRSIESGWMQSQIAEASYRYQKEIESKDRIIVGLNEFKANGAGEDSRHIVKFKTDPAVEQRQRERIAAWRERRDAARAAELMSQLEQASRGSTNLMPCLIACVEGGLTLGEVGKVLRKVFGEYEPPTVI